MRNLATSRLRLVALSVAVCLGPADADAIVCGEYVVGDLDAGASDVHTFVAAVGDRVLLNAGDDFTPEIELADPSGTPVALEPLVGLLLSAPLASAGTYSVTVTNPTSSAGDYHLTLDSITGSFGGQSNWLPSPVCGGIAEPGAPGGIGGTRVLRCGETSPPGHIGPGSIDTFTFHAAQGDVIRIDNAGIDYFVLLLDRSGDPVPFSEPSNLGPLICRGDASPGCTSTPLPSTGIYTIAAFGQDGGYQITLEALGGTFNGASNGPPTPICGLPPDGARNLCTPLPPRSGSLGGGDSDGWTFLGQAGEPATFSVTNPTPLPGLATATLWGPDGQPVLGATLPLSGVYTLLVDRDDNLIGAPPTQFPVLPYSVSIDAAACQNACADGRDNDGDGQIDLADVLGCTSRDDLSEKRECEDGIDNDGDGGIDVGTRMQPGDPACTSPNLLSEDPTCSDGADNDGDKLVDFDGIAGATQKDPQCNDNPSWISELVLGPPSCGLGPELALLLPVLAALRARRRR